MSSSSPITRSFCAAVCLLGIAPQPALAGMPSVGLSDLARMRLESISFFLLALLVSAVIVQWLWNRLGGDFAWLPRLSFGRSCGLVALWGLLFVIVLTMISGARELLTPGAWQKSGWTYQLTSGGSRSIDADANDQHQAEREARLDRLGRALLHYAAAHSGAYPQSKDQSAIPPELWQVPGLGQLQFVYVEGRTVNDRDAPLAYEPSIDGKQVLVLVASGDVVWRAFDDLLASLPPRGSP